MTCCLYCLEPVLPDEELSQGGHFNQDGVECPVHVECALRMVAGHIFGGCSCHMPDATFREQARVALATARSADDPAGDQ